MFEVILQMAALIACGVVWRIVRPASLDHVLTRKVLTSLVYYLLLPALVLSILWRAELGSDSLFIALSAASGVFAGLFCGLLVCRWCITSSAQTGAVVLAVAFPNVTYMGLPILDATFGPWARSVAIQYDLFACTPLLFTLGMLVAARFSPLTTARQNVLQDLLRIPALWAAVLAVGLNLVHLPMPIVVAGWLHLLEQGVVPLMLFSLGLSLSWGQQRRQYLKPILLVLALRLALIPLLVLVVASVLGFTGEWRAAIVMEAAMPSMVIGVMICDQYNLDVSLYASAVTATTVLSLLTLPLWHHALL